MNKMMKAAAGVVAAAAVFTGCNAPKKPQTEELLSSGAAAAESALQEAVSAVSSAASEVGITSSEVAQRLEEIKGLEDYWSALNGAAEEWKAAAQASLPEGLENEAALEEVKNSLTSWQESLKALETVEIPPKYQAAHEKLQGALDALNEALGEIKNYAEAPVSEQEESRTAAAEDLKAFIEEKRQEALKLVEDAIGLYNQ